MCLAAPFAPHFVRSLRLALEMLPLACACFGLDAPCRATELWQVKYYQHFNVDDKITFGWDKALQLDSRASMCMRQMQLHHISPASCCSHGQTEAMFAGDSHEDVALAPRIGSDSPC